MATQDINWEVIINDAIKKHAKSWEAEFLAINKTTEERIAALDKLKKEADREWHALMSAKTDPFKYEIDKASLREDYEYWKSSLDPLPKSSYIFTSDKYKITSDGRILWNMRYFKEDLNKDRYVSDEYLRGQDFFTSKWSSTPGDVLYKNLRSKWLNDLFRKKSKTTSKEKLTNSWTAWFNRVKDSTKRTNNNKFDWSNSFIESEKHNKNRFRLTMEGLFGSNFMNDNVGQYDRKHDYNESVSSISWKKAKSGIKEDISNALGELRDTYSGLMYNSINDITDDLKELGSKAINGVKAKVYDISVKEGARTLSYLRNRFGSVAGRLNGVVPSPIMRALGPANKILGNTLGNIANRLGLGRWMSDVGGTDEIDAITSPRDVNSEAKYLTQLTSIVDKEDYLHKRLDEIKQQSWEKDQLVTIGIDIRDLLSVVLEDFGYVNTIIRSLNYARNFHFVNRPVLESETNSYYRTYAFFTRPNLNLFVDGKLNPSLDQYPEMKAIVLSDPGLYAELCRDGAYKSNLFKLLNNYTKEVAPPRLAETSREGIMNMHGKSMPTPGIPEIYGENEISVTFMDNNRGDIAKLLYFLSMYKEYTAKQGYPMRSEYIKYRGLDYLMSLYIVSVDMNWNMINIAVGYSLIPPEPPTHLAQHKLDGMSKNEYMEDINVTFKCTTFIPYAPDQCDVFNILSGFNPAALVDTRGADGTTLIATGRNSKSIMSEGKAYRKPLFRANFKDGTSDTDNGDEPSFPFKGLFEMMAISPGFYRMSRVSKDGLTDTRLNIKFGFSS